ncbi:unnamed protein product [[Actinomadura] parvosata subsp. kistnae]|nr:unnamed protein product [Actinomadura parvosata subsp. kistnae]
MSGHVPNVTVRGRHPCGHIAVPPAQLVGTSGARRGYGGRGRFS